MKAIDLLSDFIKAVSIRQFPNNEWLEGSDMKVYVRKSVRFLNNKRYTCLDIANIEVFEKGKGKFTRFLEEVHNLNPWDATLVENAHDPRLQDFMIRQGYTRDYTGISFYKLR